MRNIIIGIDGGCFEHIEPLLEKNLLPNFKKLLDNGFHSKLNVTIPPVTIPSWPCLFSGLSPDQLGYYWFNHPSKGLFSSQVWKEKSIFSISGIRNFVLNVPGTYPAWKINGEMIAGMLSPKISCFPPELKFSIERNWMLDEKTIEEFFKIFEIKRKLFLSKMREDFNLMTFVIRLPDVISHHVDVNLDITFNYINLGYKKIDDFLGEILKENRVDNIFIISDHGLKIYKVDFNLSRWLEKKGLLFINKSKSNKIFSIITKLFDFIRPFIKIDYNKYKVLKGIIYKLKIKEKAQTISNKKQTNETKLMNLFGNVGGLFLGKNDKIKKNIIKHELEKDRRVKEVILSEIEGFPDFFIILKDKYLFNHQPSFFIKRGRASIHHTQNGLFIAYGKEIKRGMLDFVNYIDIAPTILNLFNLEKLDHMSGNVLRIHKNFS